MVSLIADLLGLAAVLLLIPVAVLFIEVSLAGAERSAVSAPPPASRLRLAILMPAHDEAALISATVAAVRPQLQAADRLVVIADNCSDQTAALARSAGAEVIERSDPVRRGKGYALDFGMRHIQSDPPDLVVILDADCQLGANALDKLAACSARTGRPAQALYLMHAAPNAGRMQKIAAFAWVVKNQVRAGGLHALGLPCQLMGTGMAFPWSSLHGAEVATGHIVEDLKLGLDLAREGHPTEFCPEALVTSTFPESAEGARTQRARWEHGHLSVILSETPALLWAALRRRDVKLLALALDLSVPPLALLALLIAVSWVPSGILYLATGKSFALSTVVVASILFGIAVLVSWVRFGRHLLSAKDLALAALYPLWKIPLYLRFLIARQMTWVRSKRDGDSR
jgi:cellulose synthase/poly-beta-1,6-N-acetylglucosamine synthase-like glycosyltransferase